VIPLRDINPTTRTAWLTLALIAANIVVFLFWEPSFGTQQEQQTFFFCNAEIPFETSHRESLGDAGSEGAAAIRETYSVGESDARDLQSFLERECPDKSWLAAVFVSMFLHGGWLHIGGNMLFLWVFGNNIEDRLGRIAFVLLYFLGGIAATALQVAFDPNSAIPNVGASGAIAGVLGSYLVLFPRARIQTLVIFFFITWVELPASVVLGVWFVLQLFSGVGGMGTDVGGGVAYWAHVGGFVFGSLVTWVFFRSRGRPQAQAWPFPPAEP
jgi:membrane associated rhomboid family serine protease